jgi:hypothetical protein
MKKIIILLPAIAVLLIVAINYLITTPVDKENSTTVQAHFKSVEKENYRNSISYSLFVQEAGQSYQITADWSGCFRYSAFQTEVKEGQLIQVTLKNHNGIRLSSTPLVVSIAANNINYMSADCVNLHISDSESQTPLICLGLIVFFLVYWYLTINKDKLNKPW